MSFTELYNKNVSEWVETKGQGKFAAKYLSWAYAVKELKIAFPESSYKVVLYPDNQGNKILPYLKTETGYFVSVELFLTRQDRIDNISETWTHPVLNHMFKTIEKPSSFEINTSIQRCLTKLIGISTGLGLSLYAGEDLPVEHNSESKQQVEQINSVFNENKTDLTPDQKQQKIKDSIESSFIDLKNNDGTFQEWTDLIQTLVKKYPFLVSSEWLNSISEKYKPGHEELMQESTTGVKK